MQAALFIVSIILVYIIVAFFFSQKHKNLYNKIKSLEKEVEIRSNSLNFEKNAGQESLNRLYSITVIIMEIVQEISTALTKETEVLEDEVLTVIFGKTKSLFKVKKGILLKVNLIDNLLIPVSSFGFLEKDLKDLVFTTDKNSGMAGLAVSTGRLVSIYDAENDPTIHHLLNKDKFYCSYFLPIKVYGQVRALICLGQIEEGLPVLLVNRLFSILSYMSTVALGDALLTQQLRQQSIRDGLTGLYNHSYFQKWLEDVFVKFQKENKEIAVAIFDLDNFKKVNDTYGHPAGDLVLRKVAALIKDLGVPDCISARYGGEEFILGFPGKTLDVVYGIMEKVRQQVAQAKVEIPGNTLYVTISIGIAAAEIKADGLISRQELIERADKALYKAKSAGKNRIARAED